MCSIRRRKDQAIQASSLSLRRSVFTLVVVQGRLVQLQDRSADSITEYGYRTTPPFLVATARRLLVQTFIVQGRSPSTSQPPEAVPVHVPELHENYEGGTSQPEISCDVQHYAVYMPSHHLRRLDMPLIPRGWEHTITAH